MIRRLWAKIALPAVQAASGPTAYGIRMNEPTKNIVILIAEDDPDDRLLAKEAFEESDMVSTLEFVEDGEELLEYLHREDTPTPDLILLDLNMPRKDGREALREIKHHPRFRHIPVVVLTTSNSEADIFPSYDLGASSYITKPVTFEGFLNFMKALEKYWIEVVVLPSESMRE